VRRLLDALQQVSGHSNLAWALAAAAVSAVAASLWTWLLMSGAWWS